MSDFRLTRSGTWTLTVGSALLFLMLSWIFADGHLGGPLWNSESWIDSPLVTYVLLAVILAAGAWQASRVPEEGVALALPRDGVTPGQTDDPRWWRLLVGNVYASLIWLPFRFFVGREWYSAGLHKYHDPAWMDSSEAITGYWTRAVAIPEQGRPPITYDWYRNFLQYMLDNDWGSWLSKVIVFGELLIGVGLIVGALVGLAAFFGTVLNVSFGLAGTASTNPVLFGMSVLLVLAWRTAGWWGLDRAILPLFGIQPNPESAGQAVAARVAPGRAAAD